MTKSVTLFGGALTCVLPVDFVDVSQLREVPDNQEVWVRTGAGTSEESVIIELLEPLPECPLLLDALEQHFGHLNDDSGALQATIDETPQETDVPPPIKAREPTATVAVLKGRQLVAKYREGAQAANTIQVWLALVRLPSVKTDILITLNHALAISPLSSSSSSSKNNDGSGSIVAQREEDVQILFSTLLRSLNVVDYSIFTASS